MSDKPLAGTMAALVGVPLVVVCCGGKALLLPTFAGLAGWIGGFDLLSVLLIGLAVVVATMGFRAWRMRRDVAVIHLEKDAS